MLWLMLLLDMLLLIVEDVVAYAVVGDVVAHTVVGDEVALC